MKISDLTTGDIATYLRIDDVETEETTLKMISEAVIAMMCKRTGRDADYIKAQDDLAYSYLAMCGEMYESRQYHLDKGQYKNETVWAAVDAHSINLLPDEDMAGDADA